MPKRTYRKAHGSLSYSDEDLDPLDVTKSLLLPPDREFRAGTPKLKRRPSGKVEYGGDYDHGLWSMSSEDWVDSPQVAVHIEWLLAQLEPKQEAARRIAASVEAARIFCYSRGTTSRKPSYPNRLDEEAAALGLTIDIDHYRIAD